MEPIPAAPAAGDPSDSQDWLRMVVDAACSDFAGRIHRDHILAVARDVACRFRDARVTSYVPLLVSRFTRERLLQELREEPRK
jgi:hypothetical protein